MSNAKRQGNRPQTCFKVALMLGLSTAISSMAVSAQSDMTSETAVENVSKFSINFRARAEHVSEIPVRRIKAKMLMKLVLK